MNKIYSKYIIPYIYILGIMQLMQIRGVGWGCVLLTILNIITILSNFKLILHDKTGIVKFSLFYVGIVVIYQLLTPPLDKVYNPYYPLFYHVFITTGISFWIMGYKGYNILSPDIRKIILYAIIFALLFAFTLMFKTGGIVNLLENSEIYEFLYQIVPYLMLWMTSALFLFNKKTRVLIVFLFVVIILISTKRGPLVTMGLGFLFILFFARKVSLKSVILTLLFITIFYLFLTIFDIFYLDWFNRWNASDDVSNGRKEIWNLILNQIDKQNVLTTLLGNGYEASHKITYKYLWGAIGAHNDFIDILFNFGLVGLTAFILLILSWIKIVFFANKVNYEYRDMMIYILVCFLVGSTISSNMTRYATIYFGAFFYYFSGLLSFKQNKYVLGHNKSI